MSEVEGFFLLECTTCWYHSFITCFDYINSTGFCAALKLVNVLKSIIQINELLYDNYDTNLLSLMNKCFYFFKAHISKFCIKFQLLNILWNSSQFSILFHSVTTKKSPKLFYWKIFLLKSCNEVNLIPQIYDCTINTSWALSGIRKIDRKIFSTKRISQSERRAEFEVTLAWLSFSPLSFAFVFSLFCFASCFIVDSTLSRFMLSPRNCLHVFSVYQETLQKIHLMRISQNRLDSPFWWQNLISCYRFENFATFLDIQIFRMSLLYRC